MGTDVRDALVQEWRRYLRGKQVYPLLKSSSERGIFSSPIFGTHLETAPLCQGSMSPPSIRKPLNVNGEQNFWLAPRHAAPVSLIAEEPCKCPDPSSYQRSHHSVESQPGSPLFHLLILIIALQPENTPRAVMKTLGRSHGCSASADSWPDQERM